MLINQIKHKNKSKKRIGRGGSKGTYSGKGMKGQKSRSGRKLRPALRDLIIRLPKKRGSRFKIISERPLIVNIDAINKSFNNGEIVNIATLILKKIVNIKKSKKSPKIKILGNGNFDKKLIFSKDILFSATTKEKILKTDSTIISDVS